MTRLAEIFPSQADLKFGKAKFQPFPLFEYGMIGDQDETLLSRVLGDSSTTHGGNMFGGLRFTMERGESTRGFPLGQ